MLVISTARNELWGRKHLGIGDAQSRVRRVDCRTKHGVVLLNKRRFSLILSLGPSFVTLKPPVVMLKSREKKVFILGAPELPNAQVRIFFDVEGDPERKFDYLIGVLIEK
ncbi:MAG: hypothetical protein WBQ11_01495, partial [Isosphaeraceae bacterium]